MLAMLRLRALTHTATAAGTRRAVASKAGAVASRAGTDEGSGMECALDALSLDMGGTLSKLVFYEPDSGRLGEVVRAWRRSPSYSFATKAPELSLRSASGMLRFSLFETGDTGELAASLGELVRTARDAGIELGTKLAVTGGGAYKYQDMIEGAFKSAGAEDVALDGVDEMDALAAGFRFLMANHGPEQQAYWYTVDSGSQRLLQRIPLSQDDAASDALLVNIGSGVSVIHLGKDPNSVPRRISGSSIGGSTFWGLCRLLTKYTRFNDAIRGAEEGSRDTVAMLVSDIYGSGYNAIGLDGSVVAADFGKMATMKECPRSNVSDQDLARATLVLVLNNIAQIATMNAQTQGTRQVFFLGGMLRPGIMEDILVNGVNFWSRGTIRAAFSHHQHYLGALGALVSSSRSLKPSSLVATQINRTLVATPEVEWGYL